MPKKLDYLLDVDVKTTLELSREFGRRANSGVIINVGWDQAWQGMEGDSGEMFSTTKGAIMSMTKSLAQSLAPNIRVNCIAPGWIKTDWANQASEKWQTRAREQALLDRWGTPDDIANVAAFLASEESRFITGQILAVNGGFKFWNERNG